METHIKRSSSDNGEVSIPTSFPLAKTVKKCTVPKEDPPKSIWKSRPAPPSAYKMPDSEVDLFPVSHTALTLAPAGTCTNSDCRRPCDYVRRFPTLAPITTGTNSNRKRPCDDDDLLETIAKRREELRNFQHEKAIIENKEKTLLKAQEAEVEKFNKKYEGKSPWELYELFYGKQDKLNE